MIRGVDSDRVLAQVLSAADGEAGSRDANAGAGPNARNAMLRSPCLRHQGSQEGQSTEKSGGQKKEGRLEEVGAPTVKTRQGLGTAGHSEASALCTLLDIRSVRDSPTK
jgi:hypothetical protein